MPLFYLYKSFSAKLELRLFIAKYAQIKLENHFDSTDHYITS